MRNVLEYLEAAYLKAPEKTAYASETDSLTFRQVYMQARSVGTVLLKDGLYKKPVVVFMEKSPQTITAFLGVVYAGCYYVPVDEEMPSYRMELIFKTLSPQAVICDKATTDRLYKMGYQGQVYLYEQISATPQDTKALSAVREKSIDTDALYIVFTSGSTGIPKGVVACHRSVIDYIENLSAVLQVSEDTVFGNQAPLYVDACLKEIYPTLKFAATAYLIPKQLFMFPVKLVEFINAHQINTICWVVPALTMISGLGAFEKAVPSSLKTIAFGSEVFPARQLALWRKYVPNARYINLYGPTEATGMSCYYVVDREFKEDEVIPIGRPFPNTGILLLNEDGKEVTQGEKGEICIRGTAVTMGYYRQPEKTAGSFVQNPLNKDYPEIIYKTGDLGYYNDRGELMFASRKDYQIKHMGHRIELGEIEAQVEQHTVITRAICIYDSNKKRILLFYVGNIEGKQLISELRDVLPGYMLPNKAFALDAFPMNKNGKVDRNALKELGGIKHA